MNSESELAPSLSPLTSSLIMSKRQREADPGSSKKRRKTKAEPECGDEWPDHFHAVRLRLYQVSLNSMNCAQLFRVGVIIYNLT